MRKFICLCTFSFLSSGSFSSLIFGLLLCVTGSVLADEIRPGYLQLKETDKNIFSIVWKVPAKGDKKLNINVQLPTNCKNSRPINTRLIDSAYIQRWFVSCDGGLIGQTIAVSGLATTSTDVLLHLQLLDRPSQTAHLTPVNTSYKIPAEASVLQVVSTYTFLGIEHIMAGVDHLLFVFALLLIVSDRRKLLATITAFTVAHSITLAAATLGVVQIPQQPVEAVIALSILFLALELVHGKQGRPGTAAKWPWLVAFVFGLLHGFGFAGALAEIGLPFQSIPLALVFFNVGVELGQLLFIAAVLLFGWCLHQMKQSKLLAQAEVLTIYTIGGVSSFWLIERVSSF